MSSAQPSLTEGRGADICTAAGRSSSWAPRPISCARALIPQGGLSLIGKNDIARRLDTSYSWWGTETPIRRPDGVPTQQPQERRESVMTHQLETTCIYLDDHRRGVVTCPYCWDTHTLNMTRYPAPLGGKACHVLCGACGRLFRLIFDGRRHLRIPVSLPGRLFPCLLYTSTLPTNREV